MIFFPVCFLKWEKEGVGTNGQGSREEDLGDEEEETMVSIYWMKNILILVQIHGPSYH